MKLAIFSPHTLFNHNRFDYLSMVYMLTNTMLEVNEQLHVLFITPDKVLPATLATYEKRITLIHIGKYALKKPLYKYFIQKKLPTLLEKHSAQLWSPFGVALPNFKGKQVVGLPFNPIDKADIISLANICETNAQITLSAYYPFIAKAWAATSLIDYKAINILGTGLQYQSIEQSWAMGEAIKTRHAGGYEYFLCRGYFSSTQKFIDLLKAFSAFKKRQQTQAGLIICPLGPLPAEVMEKMKSYKYRDAVFVKASIPFTEYKQLLASCYAFITIESADALQKPLLQAMSQGAASIVPANGLANAIAGDSALVYSDENELFVAMNRLFTDEELRNTNKLKAKEMAVDFNTTLLANKLLGLFSIST